MTYIYDKYITLITLKTSKGNKIPLYSIITLNQSTLKLS